MRRIFVTGAAGFIGINLVSRLLEMGLEVVGWDNFRRDKMNSSLKRNDLRITRK
jgi:nucleoside-diphosphate-sugar epimerase